MKIQSVIKTIISENPDFCGYDVFSFLKDKTGHSHQSVYKEIDKIVKDGDLISKVVYQNGKPDKITYKVAHGNFYYEDTRATTFNKSSIAYSILVSDVLNGTSHFEEYVKTMKATEKELAKKFGIKIDINI